MDGRHHASPRRLLRWPANELVWRALEGPRVTGLRHDIIIPPQLILKLLSLLTAWRFFFLRVKVSDFPRCITTCVIIMCVNLWRRLFTIPIPPVFWWKTAFRASLSGFEKHNEAFGTTDRLGH